ncbi:hypothetical protein [Streptomyces sp. CRN 30]|uniref:hypothetical protein n=1 Tax=Streptomyces sp. CRN 30 TaxID=3075613 RepID=UPI0039C4649D
MTEARSGRARDGFYGEEALRAYAVTHAPGGPGGMIAALTGPLDSFGDGLDDDTALLAPGPQASSSSSPVSSSGAVTMQS